MKPNGRAAEYGSGQPAGELQQVRSDLAVSAALAKPGSPAGALSELYRDAVSGELPGPFIGLSELDIREGQPTMTSDGPAGSIRPCPDDIIARMRARLDTVRAQLREMGQRP